MAPTTYPTMMASALGPMYATEEEKELWGNVEVLHLLQPHKYGNGLSAKTLDRIYWRARGDRSMGDNMFKLPQQWVMVVVPRPAEKMPIALDMGPSNIATTTRAPATIPQASVACACTTTPIQKQINKAP